MSSSANSLRTIFYALGANIGIFAIKLVAAIFTSSGAMMAEAVHSLADPPPIIRWATARKSISGRFWSR